MDYASAIRFGGMLVAASECTYEHYLNRGLLCPNCKDPVFLRAGSDRARGETKYTVKAHFCHFSARSEALVDECELRVNGLSRQAFERLQAQARGQRARLLQKWFWDVIRQHPRMKKFDELVGLGKKYQTTLKHLKSERKEVLQLAKQTPRGMTRQAYLQDLPVDLSKIAMDSQKPEYKEWVIDIKDWFVNNQSTVKALVDPFLDSAVNMKQNGFYAALGSIGMDASKIIDLTQSFADIDMRMHQTIVQEVIEFLSTKRNAPMLEDLLLAESTHQKTPEKCCLGVIATVATIHWADEFEKLEKRSQKVAV